MSSERSDENKESEPLINSLSTSSNDQGKAANNDISSSVDSNASSSTNKRGTAGCGYECNVCFDVASEPVVSFCGHLFCWPCLYDWMEHQTKQGISVYCPVCKASIAQDKLIPLYCRGRENAEGEVKERTCRLPSRPVQQRTEPPSQSTSQQRREFGAFNWRWSTFPGIHYTNSNRNFSFHAGFGSFGDAVPFFQSNLYNHNNSPNSTASDSENNHIPRLQILIANLFLLLAMFIFYILVFHDF